MDLDPVTEMTECTWQFLSSILACCLSSAELERHRRVNWWHDDHLQLWIAVLALSFGLNPTQQLLAFEKWIREQISFLLFLALLLVLALYFWLHALWVTNTTELLRDKNKSKVTFWFWMKSSICVKVLFLFKYFKTKQTEFWLLSQNYSRILLKLENLQ